MNSKALAVSLSTLAVPVMASASYNLLLAFDRGDKKIVRYDPVNNVYLGAFANGRLGPLNNDQRVALDPLQSRAIASFDGNAIRTFNFDTGESLGSLALLPTTSAPSLFKILGDGRYLVAAGSLGPRIYSRQGTLLASFATSGSNASLDTVEMSDGSFVSLERNDTGALPQFSFVRRSASGGLLGDPTFIAENGNSNFLKYLVRDGDKLIVNGINNSPSLLRFQVSGTNITPLAPPTYGVPTSGIGVSNLVLGHGSDSYFFLRINQDNILYHYDRGANTLTAGPGTAYRDWMDSSVLVIAPEPGSLMALGAGALLLLRRCSR